MTSTRRFLTPLFLCAVATAVSACGTDGPSPVAPTVSVETARAASDNRHLVLLRPGASTTRVALHVRALGGTIDRMHAASGILTAHGLTAAGVTALRAHPDVRLVVADRVAQWIPRGLAVRAVAATPHRASSATDNDDQSTASFFPIQWNMRVIRASNAWKITRAGSGALVCDLDTGIDPSHVDLKGKIDLGVSTSFVVAEPDILDHNTHGTYVSALISSNGINMASVAPDARLCQVKVLDQTGTGSFTDIITGVVYATDAGADVINMSLGALFPRATPGLSDLVRIFQQAVDYAGAHGVTVTVAAGNDGVDLATANAVELPAELQHVISVGATAPTNQRNFDAVASYSNFGFPGTTLFAPGGDFQPQQGGVRTDEILSACSTYAVGLPFSCADHQSYILDAGTSAAAPHVAGEAAILESAVPRGTPERRERIARCIIMGTDVITGMLPDPVYGNGRIDVIGGRDCRHII